MATTKKAPAKAAAVAAPVAAEPAVAAAKKRTPNAAFMKPLTPSAELAAVVGAAPLPRTEIISKLWVYIKANNLQDAANKRNINADAKLKKVFGKPQVSMFEMAGLIGKHVK
ncbi:MAG: SWIB/MDM2 domain-containing protein [Burkholderiaceae bacterium]|nr:SWIB/MDM2 domain-containing protein [Burkholderiaceae bacterium]